MASALVAANHLVRAMHRPKALVATITKGVAVTRATMRHKSKKSSLRECNLHLRRS